MKYSYLLLDLDGTVTDSMTGITRSVQYALKHFGIEIKELSLLQPFIGPPLKDSFKEFYHFTEEQATLAIFFFKRNIRKRSLSRNKRFLTETEKGKQANIISNV